MMRFGVYEVQGRKYFAAMPELLLVPAWVLLDSRDDAILES